MTGRELEELYDSMLDDAYGMVEVAGHSYDTSRLLKDVDPIAYRCGKIDYVDMLVQDGELTQEEADGAV